MPLAHPTLRLLGPLRQRKILSHEMHPLEIGNHVEGQRYMGNIPAVRPVDEEGLADEQIPLDPPLALVFQSRPSLLCALLSPSTKKRSFSGLAGFGGSNVIVHVRMLALLKSISQFAGLRKLGKLSA